MKHFACANMDRHYEVEAITNNQPLPAFDIYCNHEYHGTINKDNSEWVVDKYIEQKVQNIITAKLSPYLSSMHN